MFVSQEDQHRGRSPCPSSSATCRAIDLIDLNDYINLGYWHTAQDTLDKISPRSLAIVGHVILESVNALQVKFP